MSSLPISVVKWGFRFRKFDYSSGSIEHQMLRIFLITLTLNYVICVSAVVPMMSRVNYSRIQYMVPCNICSSAVLFEMHSPSSNHMEFEQKAPQACRQATPDVFKQQACVSLLTRYSRSFLLDQRKGLSVYSSCVQSNGTDCADAHFTVLCDPHKRKGYCHVIPI